jgi:hypothetical protein
MGNIAFTLSSPKLGSNRTLRNTLGDIESLPIVQQHCLAYQTTTSKFGTETLVPHTLLSQLCPYSLEELPLLEHILTLSGFSERSIAARSEVILTLHQLFVDLARAKSGAFNPRDLWGLWTHLFATATGSRVMSNEGIMLFLRKDPTNADAFETTKSIIIETLCPGSTSNPFKNPLNIGTHYCRTTHIRPQQSISTTRNNELRTLQPSDLKPPATPANFLTINGLPDLSALRLHRALLELGLPEDRIISISYSVWDLDAIMISPHPPPITATVEVKSRDDLFSIARGRDKLIEFLPSSGDQVPRLLISQVMSPAAAHSAFSLTALRLPLISDEELHSRRWDVATSLHARTLRSRATNIHTLSFAITSTTLPRSVPSSLPPPKLRIIELLFTAPNNTALLSGSLENTEALIAPLLAGSSTVSYSYLFMITAACRHSLLRQGTSEEEIAALELPIITSLDTSYSSDSDI